MQTDDTFVIGLVNNAIVFIKTFHYETQKDEAQKALTYVQAPPFTRWFLSFVGGWKMSSKIDADTQDIPIEVQMPKIK